jgi:hypothetical protein
MLRQQRILKNFLFILLLLLPAPVFSQALDINDLEEAYEAYATHDINTMDRIKPKFINEMSWRYFVEFIRSKHQFQSIAALENLNSYGNSFSVEFHIEVFRCLADTIQELSNPAMATAGPKMVGVTTDQLVDRLNEARNQIQTAIKLKRATKGDIRKLERWQNLAGEKLMGNKISPADKDALKRSLIELDTAHANISDEVTVRSLETVEALVYLLSLYAPNPLPPSRSDKHKPLLALSNSDARDSLLDTCWKTFIPLALKMRLSWELWDYFLSLRGYQATSLIAMVQNYSQIADRNVRERGRMVVRGLAEMVELDLELTEGKSVKGGQPYSAALQLIRSQRLWPLSTTQSSEEPAYYNRGPEEIAYQLHWLREPLVWNSDDLIAANTRHWLWHEIDPQYSNWIDDDSERWNERGDKQTLALKELPGDIANILATALQLTSDGQVGLATRGFELEDYLVRRGAGKIRAGRVIELLSEMSQWRGALIVR